MFCLVYALCCCCCFCFIGYYLGGLKPKPVSAGILDDLLMPPLLYSGTSQYGFFLYIVLYYFFFVFVVVEMLQLVAFQANFEMINKNANSICLVSVNE